MYFKINKNMHSTFSQTAPQGGAPTPSNIVSTGNPLMLPGVRAPGREKNISKREKIPNKNLAHTSRYYMCARQVSDKTVIFSGLCKKAKMMSCEKHF